MNQQVILSAGSALRLSLKLSQLRFGLSHHDLFQLAVRQNQKRPFLFVSKVLGKHLPIRPAALIAAGKLLSLALEGETQPGPWADVLRGTDDTPFPALMERLETEQISLEPDRCTLFVGFAETATGLARSVAACYGGACAYISTTRAQLQAWQPITFQESHSHAATHWLHLDHLESFPTRCTRAVIIDDEFTTGNTALALVETLHQEYGIAQFVLLSLLDWSSGEKRHALEEKLSIQIEQVSLLHGDIETVESMPSTLPELDDWCGRTCADVPTTILSSDLYLHMGRTLQSPAQQLERRTACRTLAQTLGSMDSDTLVLGAGELIYEPALIAGYCGAAAYHSTTQSPVHPLPGSAIETGVRFEPPDWYSSAGYLYQVPKGRYHRAVMFGERELVRPQGLNQLADWLKSRGCAQVEVVLL